MNVAQWGLIVLVFAVSVWFLFSIFYWKRPDLFFDTSERRRFGDQKYFKAAPGAVIEYDPDNGPPDEPRGRVWDEVERDLNYQRNRNKIIRLRSRG